MHRFIFTIVTGLWACIPLYSQIHISGSVALDSAWRPVLYISQINSLQDLYKSSPNLIIGATTILNDSFQITIPWKDSNAQLIRLHVSKLDEPSSMLVIGGQEENHGFYAVQSGVELIVNQSQTSLFQHFNAPDSLNQRLRQICLQVESVNRRYAQTVKPSEKLNLIQDMSRDLLSRANTSGHILEAIYATYQADIGSNKNNIQKQWNQIRDQFGNHPYLPATIQSPKSSYFSQLLFGSVTLLFVLLMIIYYIIPRRRKFRWRQKVDLLSIQERRIVQLILQGMSNKAISQELHIEVSTVKSHIRNIFGKLEIRSRKELLAHQTILSKEYYQLAG